MHKIIIYMYNTWQSVHVNFLTFKIKKNYENESRELLIKKITVNLKDLILVTGPYLWNYTYTKKLIQKNSLCTCRSIK